MLADNPCLEVECKYLSASLKARWVFHMNCWGSSTEKAFSSCSKYFGIIWSLATSATRFLWFLSNSKVWFVSIFQWLLPLPIAFSLDLFCSSINLAELLLNSLLKLLTSSILRFGFINSSLIFSTVSLTLSSCCKAGNIPPWDNTSSMTSVSVVSNLLVSPSNSLFKFLISSVLRLPLSNFSLISLIDCLKLSEDVILE